MRRGLVTSGGWTSYAAEDNRGPLLAPLARVPAPAPPPRPRAEPGRANATTGTRTPTRRARDAVRT
ncbi:MAG: hypothetical protein CVU56_22925 [Deltaproteobacteria bacterium HGW-Deltaproteobacteria-14]|nr:MAG: hypothetical protein CVU56_22925 [Deltaproteobacteria bacterium HGW-Deltaproteobacteria-14]